MSQTIIQVDGALGARFKADAAASAVDAAEQVELAENAVDDAVNAKDLALLAALAVGTYADTVAGIAATSSGDYFYTVDPANIYLNDSGTAVLQDEIATLGRPLGTFTNALIDDNATVKAAIESIGTNLAAPATGPALVGLQQDSPLAVARTIKNQLLDTWSVEQFIAEGNLAAYRAGTGTFDMAGPLQDAFDTIASDRTYGVITANQGRFKVNTGVEIDVGKVRLDLGGGCVWDVTDNDDDVVVRMTSSRDGNAFILDPVLPRIRGLNLQGETQAKGQTAILLDPKTDGPDRQISHFVIEDITLSDFDTCFDFRDNTYIGSVRDFLFYACRAGIRFRGGDGGGPWQNTFERFTLEHGTMAGVEKGMVSDGDFVNAYIRSVSFDYPVKFTTGPQFLVANKGSIEALHCHFEGNNVFSPMDPDDPEEGLFVQGSSGSAKLTVNNSKLVFSTQYETLLVKNNNTVRSVDFDAEIFNCQGYEGYLAQGLVNFRCDPGPSPQTFLAFNSSASNNICPDTFEGGTPAGWTITGDVDPIDDPFDGGWIDLTTSSAQARSGTKSLAIKVAYGLAGGSNTSCARYLPIVGDAIGGGDLWIKKPGTLTGSMAFFLKWVAGRYKDNGLFVEDRATTAFSELSQSFTSSALDWTKIQIGGANVRKPDWATHIKLEISTSGINTASSADEAAAGLIHIDDVVLTRLR